MSPDNSGRETRRHFSDSPSAHHVVRNPVPDSPLASDRWPVVARKDHEALDAHVLAIVQSEIWMPAAIGYSLMSSISLSCSAETKGKQCGREPHRSGLDFNESRTSILKIDVGINLESSRCNILYDTTFSRMHSRTGVCGAPLQHIVPLLIV